MAAAERRLAAILFSDIVGYTALMARDEAAGLRARERHRSLLGAQARRYHGDVVDENGDELVLCFPSAVEAVNCALAAQSELAGDSEFQLRIGIHLGDVVFDEGRVYGDGVNVASRVRPHAEPGGVCISDEVEHSVANQSNLEAQSLGPKELKGVVRAVEVFAVRGRPGEPSAIAPETMGQRAPASILVAAALGITALTVWLLPSDAPRRSAPGSLVVLPFSDLSPGRDQAYFAHGMSEELTSTLASVPELRIVGRTSAEVAQRRGLSIPEIGRELDVGAVVEGSVRKSGNQLRITVQLVSVEDGFHLWSKSYDRPLGDVLAVQGEIAGAVAEALETRVLGTRLTRPPTDDLRAYELYLMGRSYRRQVTPEGRSQAILYFQQAVEADSDFALAHVGLAEAHAVSFYYGDNRSNAALSTAKAAADRALALDDSLGEAHCTLGLLALMRRDWPDAELELKWCLEQSPGYANGHRWYAIYLGAQGRVAEKVEALQRAVELDPLSGINNRDLGWAYLAASDYDAAIESFRSVRKRNPEYGGNLHIDLTSAYLLKGAFPEAVEESLQQDLPEDVRSLLRRTYDEEGIEGFIRKSREVAVAATGDPCANDPSGWARAAAFLGERDAAFACLDEFVEHGIPLGTLRIDPFLRDLRDDPRFHAILAKMNLAD